MAKDGRIANKLLLLSFMAKKIIKKHKKMMKKC